MEKMTDFDTEQEKCICLKKACYEYAKEHFRGKKYLAIISIKNIPNSDERMLIYYHHYLADIKIEPSSTLSRQFSMKSSVVLLDSSPVPI